MSLKKICFVFCLAALTAGCENPEADSDAFGADLARRGGVPNREWVPGCDSAGRADEKNPHCVDPARIELISEDPRFVNLHSIATDGAYLYIGGSEADRQARVWKLPIEGGEAVELYSRWWSNSTGGWAFALEVTGGELFVVDPNSGRGTDTQILKGPVTGGARLQAIYTEHATPGMTSYDIIDGSGIATDGVNLFITDHVQGRVSRMRTDGTAPASLSSGRFGGFFDLEHRNTVAYLGSTLFIADSADRGNCNCGSFTPEILALPAAGGAFTSLYAGAPLVHPYDIEADPVTSRLVIVDAAAGNSVFVLDPLGRVLTTIHSGAPFTRAIGVAIHNGYAYILDSGDYTDEQTGASVNGPGRIFRLPLPQNM
ncbi:MAG TPA: hypothetical protein VFV50_03310 [Bdellovibrionales bacterium]|nr:hypothetical protein [Bdellovibrionales bacterium]